MRARVVLYDEGTNSVLLISRLKNGRHYWVIPGGGREGNEAAKQTAIREVREELDIYIDADSLNYLFTDNDSAEPQQIFLSRIKRSAVTNLTIHGVEKQRQSITNTYTPTWIDVDTLESINLLSPTIRSKLYNYFFRIEKINVSPCVLSIDGSNSIGKATFIASLIKKNNGIRCLALESSPLIEDSNWWFRNSTPVELIDELTRLLLKRDRAIDDLKRVPVIILDKGLLTIRVRVEATLVARGISDQKVTKLLRYFDSCTESLRKRNEVNILLRPSNASQAKTADNLFEKYDNIQKSLFRKLKPDYILEYNAWPSANNYKEMYAIMASSVRKHTQRLLNFTNTSFIGLSGLSESGKSIIGSKLDERYNIWNLKIIYFINTAKTLVDPQNTDLLNSVAVHQMVLFSIYHYFKSAFTIESVFSDAFNNVLVSSLGNKYKLVYISASKRQRKLRSRDSAYDLAVKDQKKIRGGISELERCANLIIDNNGTLSSSISSLANSISEERSFQPVVKPIFSLKIPKQVVDEVAKLQNLAKKTISGLKLFAIVGSAGSGTYIPGWSDLDIMMIVDETSSSNSAITNLYTCAGSSDYSIGLNIVSLNSLQNHCVDAKNLCNIYNIEHGYFSPSFFLKGTLLPVITLEELQKKNIGIQELYIFEITRILLSQKISCPRKAFKKALVSIMIDLQNQGMICITYDEVLNAIKYTRPEIYLQLKKVTEKLPNCSTQDVLELIRLVVESHGARYE